jgi:hypothetical protein
MPVALEHVQPEDWAAVNRVVDALRDAVSPPLPQARVFNSANISIPTGTVTALTFNSERYDNGGLHSTSANTGRLTAPITGLYVIGGNVRFAANATGIRNALIRLNGTTFIATDTRQATGGGNATDLPLETQYQLTAGDFLELVVFQDSGGALNVTAGANFSPEFWMTRLGGFTNQGV